MPSTSKKQAHLMAAVAHNPEFAKKVGIPQSVGKDFNAADKGKKFAKGGEMDKKKLFGGKETYSEELKEAKAIKSGKITPQEYAKGEKGEEAKMKGGGATRMPKKDDMGSMGMKSGGKYARGGGIESKGKTKGKMFAKGGGIEIKGKTKGKVC